MLYALIRGFLRVQSQGLGSFWVDMTRSILYVLLPLNLVLALCLAGNGVVQTMDGGQAVSLREPVAVSADGTILSNAAINLDTGEVRLNGAAVPGARIVTEQFVPLGPAASQIAIKQTGTNGGGFFGANSAL